MKILAINTGSSSLKFTLMEIPKEKTIASGVFEKIGIGNSFYTIKYNGEKIQREIDMVDHNEAVRILIDELINLKIVESLDEIDGIGHRIVQGANLFTKSVIIDQSVLEKIDGLSDLAPLHNPAHVIGIKAFMSALPNTPMVAVFDTSYHQTMKEEQFLYPVPYEWYTNYSVRKYGAHGTSHRFIYKTISEYLHQDKLKVISCHIGNGASITAIENNQVIDTSMGFTPLAGVMMGTRCGDIDVSFIPYVMKREETGIDSIMTSLNKKSGLLGVSGISSDSRDVEDAAKNGNERAILAQNMYANKCANYIAMYNNLLNGADVICLTAGVGENSKLMRSMIIERVKSLGIKLDETKNDFRGEFRLISSDDSSIPVYVVPTNEELMIAIDTYNLIK